MSGLTNLAAFFTAIIKKYFPQPQPLVARTISAITNASSADNAQSYPDGVYQVRLLPLTEDIKVCWNPPSVGSGDTMLDDTTADADVQMWETVPAGAWHERTFETPITLWVMRSKGAGSTVVEQQVTPA